MYISKRRVDLVPNTEMNTLNDIRFICNHRQHRTRLTHNSVIVTGMTEEQKRLTLHCHLPIWSVGYNDFSSLRETIDKNAGSYQELASLLSRTIFSQIASPEDVQDAMRGGAEPSGVDSDHVPPPNDPVERPATECIAVPPPSVCCPPPRVDADVVTADKYLGEFHANLANITATANTHRCTFTYHKHGHAKSYRYVPF